jgi:hypothetical protein
MSGSYEKTKSHGDLGKLDERPDTVGAVVTAGKPMRR